MGKKPASAWRVCRDGIVPIADAATSLAKTSSDDILAWLDRGEPASMRGTFLLALARQRVGDVEAARDELVRRWLQSHGYEADADEFRSRLDGLVEDMGTWQEQIHYDAHNPQRKALVDGKRDAGEFVEVVDILGRDIEWFIEFCEGAEDFAGYLRQLALAIKGEDKGPPKQKGGRNFDQFQDWQLPIMKAWVTDGVISRAEAGERLGQADTSELDNMRKRYRRHVQGGAIDPSAIRDSTQN